MSSDTYAKIQDNVGDVINQAAWEEIKKVGAEEARLARECGDINSDGMPAITVIAEGAWSKRSYKNKYDASSGVAAIVLHRTGKVLNVGVKDKICATCACTLQESLADTCLPKRKIGRCGHLRDVPVKGMTAKLVLPLVEPDSTDNKNDRIETF
ncbi:hypothetical protein MRX96_028456 [Rhipicephalus microplus]